MALEPDEFIRRFLLHGLPTGFHRIRHNGFLANGHRQAKLTLIRRLFDQPQPPRARMTGDYRTRLYSLRRRSRSLPLLQWVYSHPRLSAAPAASRASAVMSVIPCAAIDPPADAAPPRGVNGQCTPASRAHVPHPATRQHVARNIAPRHPAGPAPAHHDHGACYSRPSRMAGAAPQYP
jgi:hypothetical protein